MEKFSDKNNFGFFKLLRAGAPGLRPQDQERRRDHFLPGPAHRELQAIGQEPDRNQRTLCIQNERMDVQHQLQLQVQELKRQKEELMRLNEELRTLQKLGSDTAADYNAVNKGYL